MFFDINNSTYLQNRNNFYVGNINTDENIKFKCDYLVIGNIRTNSMLIAMGNLIVIGNIEASSVFINNDLFCTGNIITESIDVDGEKTVLNRSSIIKEEINDKSIEEYIVELIYKNIKYYGYNRESVKVKMNKDTRYYINLELRENDINMIFLGYINKLIKSIGEELKDIKIYLELNENIKILIYKLLHIEMKYINIKYENSIVKINNHLYKLKSDDLMINKKLIEDLYECSIMFLSNTCDKDKSIDKLPKENNINILIENISEVLSKKNKELLNEKECCNILNKQIRFQCSELNCSKLLDLEYGKKESSFNYIKYNKKIYINSEDIFKILDISKSYKSSTLSDCILVNYGNGKENNISKFYNLNNYYNFIIETSKKYKTLNINDRVLVSLYNSIYSLDLESKNIKDSVPLWSKVIDKLLNYMTEETLKQELKISDDELNEIKQGYMQSRGINKLLKKLYAEYCSKDSDRIKIEKVIYEEMNKKKYNLEKIKIHDIKNEGNKKYTVYIESKQHTEKTLKIITNTINSHNNEYIIDLKLYHYDNSKNRILGNINDSMLLNNEICHIKNIKQRKDFTIGEEIIHDLYGTGIITSFKDNLVIIQFGNSKKRFDIDTLINKSLVKKLVHNRG